MAVLPLTGRFPPPPANNHWAKVLTEALSRNYNLELLRLEKMLFQGATAVRPAADGSNRVFFNTTTKRAYIDDGSWRAIGGGEPIDVRDYGATGDGVTDDTTAIRAAIAAAQNALQPKKVIIPAGDYLITDTLLPDPLDLRTVYISGEGWCSRIINGITGAAFTGTVTVANGSATVTGAGTAFTDNHIGATVRFGAEEEFYRITGVPSATEVTLDETYRGSLGAGVTMRWHKPVFAIIDTTSSQILHNGTRIENLWIDNAGTYAINNRSNAIELVNGVHFYLKNLILTPFGHGICHRKTTIIGYCENISCWPVAFNAVPSASLYNLDAVRFETGSEDAIVYRNLFAMSCRAGVHSGQVGAGASTQQTVFDTPLIQALGLPPGTDWNGTATAIGAATLTDSGKAWAVNKWRDFLVTITSGAGVGQCRLIASNTATALTLKTSWDTTDLPDNTSVYQIAGGGMIFGGGALGVMIRSPYFEDTPGVGSGGDPTGEICAYFGEGTNGLMVENTSNATGAYILANGPSATETYGNLFLGGQIDRLRIDTMAERNLFVNVRLNVQGGAGSGVVDNSPSTTFINSPRSGFANYAGNQRFAVEWEAPVTLGVNDATPSVKGLKVVLTANTLATSITNFDDGRSGQMITIIAGDANTTIVHGATINNRGGVNLLLVADKTYTYVLNGSVWSQVN